jgi:hypothetical protein
MCLLGIGGARKPRTSVPLNAQNRPASEVIG